jgi:hypothetical protein
MGSGHDEKHEQWMKKDRGSRHRSYRQQCGKDTVNAARFEDRAGSGEANRGLLRRALIPSCAVLFAQLFDDRDHADVPE